MSRPPNIPQRKLPTPIKSSPQQNSVALLITQGLASHQQGKLDEAKVIYEKVLAIQPNHAICHSYRGIILYELKRLDEALASFDKAISIKSDFAEAYSNRGIILQELKRLDEALINYDKAISIKPDYVEAHSNRGNTLQELKRLDEALASHGKAICIKPDDAEAHYNRGVVLQELKRLDEALASYEKAIGLKPDYAEAYFNYGNVLGELKRLDEALASYDNAIAIKPDHAEVFFNRGNVLRELKLLDEALTSYDNAIAIKPNFVNAYSNRGILLQDLKRLHAALVSYEKAIRINPDYAEAYFNQAIALRALNRLDEALISYDKAVSIKPDYVEAYSNRGVVLHELNRLDEALASYDNAIAIKPDFVSAYTNRGIALHALKNLDEALSSYHKAIGIKPDDAPTQWNLSLCNLLGGNFKNGWEGYEWRWKNEDISKASGVRNFSQPLWLGVESLKDKTILIYVEQGLGDTIQFCRYCQLVTELGAKVILEVQQPLVNLLKNTKGIKQIIARGGTPTNFDYQCPLLSLPLAFKTELLTIPPPQAISTHKEKITEWQAKLGEKTKPRIGIVWSGNTEHKNDHNRSLTLSKLLRYLPANVEYICLQKELRATDKELLSEHSQIKYFGDNLEDFTDTSALCELMDVVISVDTSVAHLAGTLGKPTWVLLPYSPDWRWLLDRDDSPWYPSVKLYRQEKIYDWDGVLEKVRFDLEKLVT